MMSARLKQKLVDKKRGEYFEQLDSKEEWNRSRRWTGFLDGPPKLHLTRPLPFVRAGFNGLAWTRDDGDLFVSVCIGERARLLSALNHELFTVCEL